jgi:hypothetical protein
LGKSAKLVDFGKYPEIEEPAVVDNGEEPS